MNYEALGQGDAAREYSTYCNKVYRKNLVILLSLLYCSSAIWKGSMADGVDIDLYPEELDHDLEGVRNWQFF